MRRDRCVASNPSSIAFHDLLVPHGARVHIYLKLKRCKVPPSGDEVPFSPGNAKVMTDNIMQGADAEVINGSSSLFVRFKS